jgi:hypothetical protein
MKLSYNVTGGERKRLVTAVSGILGSEPKYLGAPSFAYEVGCFTVDKNGAVIFDERTDSEKVQNLIERLEEQGFAATETETGNEDSGLTIEKCFDVGRLFGALTPEELPTRYLHTYCRIERMWGRWQDPANPSTSYSPKAAST